MSLPNQTLHDGICHGGSPNEERSATRPLHAQEKEEPSQFLMSFLKWCASLTAQVLRTRTAFSKFLVDSFSSQSSPLAPSPALFPLALPGEFPKMIPGASSRVRRKIHLERVVYIMVLALNFWHFGGSFVAFEVLRRRPSTLQLAVHRRLRGFLKSEAVVGEFKLPAAGRKFPQLIARLAELSSAVTFLGLSGTPYSTAFQGAEVRQDNTWMEELEPYRSLNAERLKLSGSGSWDITSFLPDSLCMAYREPASIFVDRIPGHGEFPLMTDGIEEIGKLAKIWDARGLLFLHQEEVPIHEQVRIFNCYKSATADRQIGDRRGRNAVECKLEGPSSSLPAAVAILDLVVPRGFGLFISCSDRKDFYHQLWSSERRCITNSLGPPLPKEMLEDTQAFAAFCLRSSSKKYNRLKHGDYLGLSGRHPKTSGGDAGLRISFPSVLQGDHGGVEYATAAHESLLQFSGCLHDRSRVTSDRPLFSNRLAEGLVIDDYFAVSVEPSDCHPSKTDSFLLHGRAQAAYEKAGLMGSPEKDVVAEKFGKVIGAQLNSTHQARSNGMVLAAAASEKRLALSWISLQIAQLRRTTDQLHLCLLGGWVSALMFRRPAMSLLNKAFHLVGQDYVASNRPKLLHLPLAVAEELTLLSVLMPLLQSDLAVEMCPKIFATDASYDRGAIVEADAQGYRTEILHRACKTKGSYTRLAPRESLVLREIDDDEWDNTATPPSTVDRPIAFKFQFLEVLLGPPKVSDSMMRLGFVVGPPIELSTSEEYNARFPHVMSWIAFYAV